MTWDEEDLERLGRALAGHIGPLAGMLVRKAQGTAHSRAHLIEELVSHIPNTADREAFRAKCERLARGGQTTHIETPPNLDPGAAMAMTQPPGTPPDSKVPLGSAVGQQSGGTVFVLEPEVRDRVVQAMADHIGPVARVVVKRELRGARDLADLANRLLANLPDEAARRTFKAVIAKIA